MSWTKHKHCRRVNSPGHAHALTFSCFRGQPFLSKERPCCWLVEAIAMARDKHDFDVWAYVVMPEHVHLLVWPRSPNYQIGKVLATIKQSVTHKALLYVRRNAPEFLPRMLDAQPSGRRCHRFWQRGGGYDRNLTEPSTICQHIEYIHANPVRRGLYERPEDWQWSSAADYARIRQGPLSIDWGSLPPMEESV